MRMITDNTRRPHPQIIHSPSFKYFIWIKNNIPRFYHSPSLVTDKRRVYTCNNFGKE